MATEPSQSEGRDRFLALLNAAIEGLNLAKEVSSITPAKAVFGTASVLLVMIRVRSLQLRDVDPPVHIHLGLDGQ